MKLPATSLTWNLNGILIASAHQDEGNITHEIHSFVRNPRLTGQEGVRLINFDT